MHDEDAYRRAHARAAAVPCPFARALLARCIECGTARRHLLAEREAVSCTDEQAAGRCAEFYIALHRNGRFALHVEPGRPWPFGKEIRAQCGGVLGLRVALGQGDAPATDVACLLAEGLHRYGAIDRFPYSEIMRGVVHYQPRKRRC
jgi:hypothetical protein